MSFDSKSIRQQFIDFFISKDHTAVKSAPVIPIDDPTLLFTNAGMNQFKDIFLGKRKPEIKRAVDSQKCIRAGGKHNDLDEVGKDGYHHTFFEMLGNWSFGDYYKKEAITWAWELLTVVWGLPKDKLYATVYKSDEESYRLWKELTDIDNTHIEYHDDKDNFWEMGEVGPCGPCSEIHFDRGEEFCNLSDDPSHECKVNGDCHRYIELWNLVFIQYDRQADKSLKPLPSQYVDTGAGFERVCQVLQNKTSNYDTDLFIPIIKKIENLSGVKYYQNDKGTSHRVIADHIRALTFAISDGELPSNEGRGYVLRRILRRAAHHGRLLGMKKPFLASLVDVVAETLGHHYSEIISQMTHTKMIIESEEKRFNLTLDKGLIRFKEIVAGCKTGEKNILGLDAFTLYDTYGFPLDLTKIMAEDAGYTVDEKGFKLEMEKQKKRARNASKFVLKDEKIDWIIISQDKPTEFVGYRFPDADCNIIKYSLDDDNNVKLVLDKTPFYAESGGQVADKGRIYNKNCEIKIEDVQKDTDSFIHIGKLISGYINDDVFEAVIEQERHKRIERNHTATHLLQKVLKEVLGEHVNQKGSAVHPDHLRFDFTHFKQVSERELRLIEQVVNEKIRANMSLETKIMDIDEAKKSGATALFGEKYGDTVRVVSIGDYSRELCGGTHLKNSGEIGILKITSESSIASGVRRIEAVTGDKAEKLFYQLEDQIQDISKILNVPETTVIDKIEKLLKENKQLHDKLKTISAKSAGNILDQMIEKAIIIDDVKVVIAEIKVDNQNEMRQIGDQLKDKLHSGVGILIAKIDEKVGLLAIVTKDLIPKFHAGKIVGKVAQIVDGRGGGRPDMAMAGGKNSELIPAAIKEIPNIIKAFI